MDREQLELLTYEQEILFAIEENINKQMNDLSLSMEKYADLKSIVLSNEALIKQLFEKIDSDKKMIQEYEKQILEKDRLLEEQKKYDAVKLDATKVTELLLSVQQKETELDEKKQEYESEIDNLKLQVNDYKGKYEEEKKERQKLNRNYQTASAELRQEKKKVEEQEKTIQELEEIKNQNDEIKNDYDEIYAELTTKREEVESLTQEKKKWKEEKKFLKELEADYDWLLGYAKATDKKVVEANIDYGSALKDHQKWLTGDIRNKDSDYRRIMGVEYDGTSILNSESKTKIQKEETGQQGSNYDESE